MYQISWSCVFLLMRSYQSVLSYFLFLTRTCLAGFGVCKLNHFWSLHMSYYVCNRRLLVRLFMICCHYRKRVSKGNSLPHFVSSSVGFMNLFLILLNLFRTIDPGCRFVIESQLLTLLMVRASNQQEKANPLMQMLM